MSITDVLIRSISGYVFVVPGVLLYFCYLHITRRRQTPLHISAAFVFCYYLIGILTMTGIGKLTEFSPKLGLVPFLGMISGPIDTVLNVILFVPLGFFLPLLFRKYNSISRVALTGLLLSLAVELVQMFGRGSTDIDDLITNAVGAVLGYFIYKLLSGLARDGLLDKFRAEKTNEGTEILFFIVYSFIIMVTIQPMVIHSLFRLG